MFALKSVLKSWTEKFRNQIRSRYQSNNPQKWIRWEQKCWGKWGGENYNNKIVNEQCAQTKTESKGTKLIKEQREVDTFQ